MRSIPDDQFQCNYLSMYSYSSFFNFEENVFNVKFYPENPLVLAVVSNENFGLYGKGTLHILHNIPGYRRLELKKSYNTSNALFDVCWLPQSSWDQILITASGDGKVQLWDLKNPYDQPIKSLAAHTREVTSIDCQNSNNVLSASWDGTIKTWDLTQGTNLVIFKGHHDLVHEVRLAESYFASVCGNGTLGLWSQNTNKCIFSIKSHDVDVLSCDFFPFDLNHIATGGIDGIVRYWDFRYPKFPITQFKASDQPVRRVRFSPYIPNVLAVGLDDGSTQILDTRGSHLIDKFMHHKGVVSGLDWCPNSLGGLADCSWDKFIRIFDSRKVSNFNLKI